MIADWPVRGRSGETPKAAMWVGYRSAILLTFGMFASFLLLPTQVTAQQEPPQRVSGPQISALIRNTITAVNHANLTGNYTVLRDLGSLSFHNTKSAAHLADIFRPFREGNVDLADAVLLDPRLGQAPKLTTDGVLKLKGWFKTKPQNLTFDLTYRFENQLWRIMSISLGFRPHAEKASSLNRSLRAVIGTPG